MDFWNSNSFEVLCAHQVGAALHGVGEDKQVLLHPADGLGARHPLLLASLHPDQDLVLNSHHRFHLPPIRRSLVKLLVELELYLEGFEDGGGLDFP